MANVYSQLYNHFVIVVQHRDCLIQPEWQEELHKYMTGCVTNHKKCKLLSIGGIADHVHLFVGMGPDISPTELITDVKRSASLWINQKFYSPGVFSWQKGYGVFSHARSTLSTVCRYIQNQAEHHKTKTMREEYIHMLKNAGVEYDEQYIFKNIF
ncbi:MAG: IS200/IS605 family transposase [Bacteroidales bacterium]|nr:IS200/IS605 family transposase [Bacteroidales bacterium]